MNQRIAIAGEIFNIPLFWAKFRECVRSYIIFADENIPDEQIPWATIIIRAPLTPQEETEMMPKMIKAMWTTEEYAIITLRSLNLTQTALSRPPPTSEIINTFDNTLTGAKNILIRIIPYPPNLRRTPARIMEPPTGASTWALGSQWWTKNIGNFTKNAPINMIVDRAPPPIGAEVHAWM